jgi:hypothetical protein
MSVTATSRNIQKSYTTPVGRSFPVFRLLPWLCRGLARSNYQMSNTQAGTHQLSVAAA